MYQSQPCNKIRHSKVVVLVRLQYRCDLISSPRLSFITVYLHLSSPNSGSAVTFLVAKSGGPIVGFLPNKFGNLYAWNNVRERVAPWDGASLQTHHKIEDRQTVTHGQEGRKHHRLYGWLGLASSLLREALQ